MTNSWKIINKKHFFVKSSTIRNKNKYISNYSMSITFSLFCFAALTLYQFLYRHLSLLNVRVRVSYLRNLNFDFARKNTSSKTFLMQCYNYYALFSVPGLSFAVKSLILT